MRLSSPGPLGTLVGFGMARGYSWRGVTHGAGEISSTQCIAGVILYEAVLKRLLENSCRLLTDVPAVFAL